MYFAFVCLWPITEFYYGAASVARAWSGYVDSLLGGIISNITLSVTGEMHEQLLGRYPDVLAFAVCITYTLLLGIGVKGSTIVNNFLTIANLIVMIVVISMGLYYADESNWGSENGGFLPYGVSGVIAGAATCFYAFVGFDSIATSGEEAKNPAFSIPIATVLSMAVVTIGYVLVSTSLTLLVPYYSINPVAALPDAFSGIGVHWVKYLVSVGAICGMTTTLFGSLFSLPRCMYAMATDGLLFGFLGNVNSRTQIPLVNLAISGILSAIIALLFDLEKLVEFMSIGTLLAYTIVSASVIILRYRPGEEPNALRDSTANSLVGTLKPQFSWLSPVIGNCPAGAAVTAFVVVFTVTSSVLCVFVQIYSDALRNGLWYIILILIFMIAVQALCIFVIVCHHQSTAAYTFKVPLVPFLPALSILCNIEFMVHLNVLTWLRFFVWMVVGMLVYFLYGIHHSKEGESLSSYSMLMTSTEAGKETWGATTRSNIKAALTRKKTTSEDRTAIVDEEEVVQ